MGRSMIVVTVLLVFLKSIEVNSQEMDMAAMKKKLETEGQLLLKQSNCLILKYDYMCDSNSVEAIVVRPAEEGNYPALLLIPGFSRTAYDYLPLGIRLAKEGFACLAVTQPGFGKSTGKADFVGPATIKALETGLAKFKAESYVDSERIGVFGYSRGAMAASLLAVRPNHIKAAVFGAGIYDFKRAYEAIKLEAIKENMEAETGLRVGAVAERSSLFMMDKLECPVLILHGEGDENAPVSQAYLLRDKLTELGKVFQIEIYPRKGHDLGMPEILAQIVPFFKVHLASSGKE